MSSESRNSAPPASRARNYVLVHGAWFGAWVWGPTAKILRAMGHNVYAPSLTGLGEKQHLLRPGINLDTHATDVVNVIEMEDLRDVVLVGWSYGGMVIPDVLARVKDRIASMVYLDAFVPERGKCQMDYPNKLGTPFVIAKMAAECRDLPAMPPNTWLTDPADIAFVAPRLGPQPILTLLQASKALEKLPTAEIAHSFVLADLALKRTETFLPFWEMMSANPDVRAERWDTDHAMMWTHPQRTAEFLASVR